MALKTALIILVNLATISIPAYAGFINGDFQTGDLTGWAAYLTSNGASGGGNPFVALVDTTGSGTSLAPFFEVGEAVSDGTQQGGGLSQNLVLPAGYYVVTASVATQEHGFGTFWAGSLFSLLVDGVFIGSVDLGAFPVQSAILRGSLNVPVAIASGGSHQFQFQITTPYRVSASISPSQFIDNIAITAVPEPTGATTCSVGFMGLFLWAFRRRP